MERFKAPYDITTWKAVVVVGKTEKWRGIYLYSRKTFPFNTEIENTEQESVGGKIMTRVAGGFFHSCRDIEDAKFIKKNSDTVFNNGKRESPTFQTAIFKCVIPQGTDCYMDEYGNYASRKIKVIKV